MTEDPGLATASRGMLFCKNKILPQPLYGGIFQRGKLSKKKFNSERQSAIVV